jgi:lysophospholipase L1-like esterase
LFHLSGLALHNDYPTTTSQLTVAVAFLHNHPHQVHIITISLTDLIGNALSHLYFGTCKQDPACTQAAFPGFLVQAHADADQILTALQAASPSSEIIVLQEFDPYMLAIPLSVPLFQQMNAVLASVATAHQVVLADGVTPFTPANLCTLTFFCIPPLHDIHPTDQGYQVLARAVWRAYENN